MRTIVLTVLFVSGLALALAPGASAAPEEAAPTAASTPAPTPAPAPVPVAQPAPVRRIVYPAAYAPPPAPRMARPNPSATKCCRSFGYYPWYRNRCGPPCPPPTWRAHYYRRACYDPAWYAPECCSRRYASSWYQRRTIRYR